MNSSRPIPDSYWVGRGRLLAGEYPGAVDDDESEEKVHSLLAAGVTVFIDLTEEGELKPYTDIVDQEAEKLGVSTQHHRRPIRNYGTPTSEAMIGTLDAIDEATESGETVYVHCFGGIGRTGTVVGCYLVRHGMTGVEALDQIAQLRQGTPEGWQVSPETEEQRDMVLSPWKVSPE
jgi:hypothetical protein